ncbi:MAG TPA: hypothetical protein PLQ92_07420 [Methanomassiliicoccales archaeon]|nr:hypothetical protein [Methanomassiliicoccales archaeon]
MRTGWDERTLFHSYIIAVVVLFVLYIIPVILLDFLSLEIEVSGTLGDLAGAVYHYFFLIGVPLASLFLGALSMGVLGWRAAPEGPKELPQYIGYLMLFVTLLSIIIWIIDMSVY